jgi:GT2 family glycosyltransferase
VDVSIIIVNLNARQLLDACLASIYEYTRDVTFEIIVVDNHSSDGSVEMVKSKFPQVHLIQNTINNRYAISNNQGLAVAKGKYVLYLNSDILFRSNGIHEMYHFLENHEDAGGVGGELVYSDGSYQDSCFRFPSAVNLFYLSCLARFYWKTRLAGNYLLEHCVTPQHVDFVVGACFMARRELLQQCHGMDEGFYLYGEDSDLCYRMRTSGSEVYYLPLSEPVIHYGGASTMQLFDNKAEGKLLLGWKARFLFIKKHYSIRKKLCILIAMFAGFGVNILLYSLAFVKRLDWGYTRKHLDMKWKITREVLKVF